jgi:hypothetical protein
MHARQRGAEHRPQRPTPGRRAQVSIGNKEARQYCSAFNTSTIAPVNRQNNYFKFSIPLAAFRCPAGYGLDRADQVTFASAARGNVSYCLSEIGLVAAPVDGSSLTSAAGVGAAFAGSPAAAPGAAPAAAPAAPAVLDQEGPSRDAVQDRTTVRAVNGGGVDDYQYSPAGVNDIPPAPVPVQTAAPVNDGGDGYYDDRPRRPRGPRRRPQPDY